MLYVVLICRTNPIGLNKMKTNEKVTASTHRSEISMTTSSTDGRILPFIRASVEYSDDVSDDLMCVLEKWLTDLNMELREICIME